MDGVKSAMVTWTVGRAGEGLQGLGNAPYPLPLFLAPLPPMLSPLLHTVRVSGRVAIAVVDLQRLPALLERAGEGASFSLPLSMCGSGSVQVLHAPALRSSVTVITMPSMHGLAGRVCRGYMRRGRLSL
jgi:hypothetical protein